MDYYWGLLIWAGVVVVSMLIVIPLAQRWGRDPFGFALFAAVAGPIAIVALIGTHQGDKSRPQHFEEAGGARSSERCVLVATDGSESGTRAAAAIPNFGMRDVEVVVLTVMPREAEPRGDASPEHKQQHQREVERLTRDAVDALERAEVPRRVVVGYGSPGETIVAAARQQGAELIIVGRRGAGLTKALLGSASDHVVKNASVPVVVID